MDGQNGVFVFTSDDPSLNIFVSNLTLRVVNQAMIENCDDELFFDNFPLKNILVEAITFFCTRDGVDSIGAFENVTLRNNIFRAGLSGINMDRPSSDWLIIDNLIQADRYGIAITGANKFVITDNHISGNVGIFLQQCSQFQVRKNAIHASEQGVLLAQESWKNMVQTNTILGVIHSEIALESGVTSNWILANRVLCAPGTSCLTVEATPGVAEMNMIAGNHP